MDQKFILLSRKGRTMAESMDWLEAVNVAHIESIKPLHTTPIPAGEQPPSTVWRARPQSEAEAIEAGLSGFFEVVTASGAVYRSSLGDNQMNAFLGNLYSDAVGGKSK